MNALITRRQPEKPGAVMHRLAPGQTARPSTYDAKAHTVTAVMATTFPVERFDFVEVLRINPNAVDLSRVRAGACKLLNAHNSHDIEFVLGTVEDAWIENGELLGRIRFADNAAGRAAEQDVARGTLSSLSVGYRVRKYRAMPREKGSDVDVLEVVDWMLLECSIVPVPADPHSAFRSVSAPTPRAPVRRVPTMEEAERNLASLRLELLDAQERLQEIDEEVEAEGGYGRADEEAMDRAVEAEERVKKLQRRIATAEKRADVVRSISAPARR